MCKECSPDGPKMECEAGEVECPVCGHVQDDDAYFERSIGSEVECQGCGLTLVIVNEETTTEYTWQARPR